MTLFSQATPTHRIFAEAINVHFQAHSDNLTLNLLRVTTPKH